MSHFVYAVIFLLASSVVAAILQANSKEQFFRYFAKRFLTPVLALIGFSWLMLLLGKL